MNINNLYFIKDEYFKKYQAEDNKPNKKSDRLGEHNRPCYYAFKENDILWMIPISSQCEKYKKIYEDKIKKYGVCDTIVFGYVKGNKNVFLLQNMIPVTEDYIEKVYTYVGTDNPITVNEKKKKELNAKARKIIRLARIGTKLTFTPILEFEKRLKEELSGKKDI